MEEEKQLLGTRGFDAAQEGWNKLTGGVSSVIQSGVQAADDFIDENIPGGEQFTARWRQGAVRILGGTARFVQQELEAADRQVDDPIDHIGDLPYFAVGAFDRGKQQYTENARRMAESAGIDPRAGNVLGEVASEIATFGAGKLASTATKVIPPGTGGLTPQLATVSNVPTPTKVVPQVTKGGVVMKAASTLPTPTNWQNRARDLFGKQEHKKLADFFRKGQGGKLKQKNLFITADELALNKGGVLDQQLERADRMADLRTKWDKQGKEIKGDRQRELYDAASLNPNISDIEMYSSTPARNYITKFTNILSKDQWHHVFGNKEAGEFILSIAHSDPLVAANLFKKMESLGLNSSGIASNIAILKEAKHTNWHNFIKDMGFEPKSPGKALTTKGSTAPGDFADLSQELGRAIVSGKADINDAFELIELYSKYNEWMKKQITSEKFGGKIVSELPEGVGKAVQIGGYRTRPPKTTYKPLPSN